MSELEDFAADIIREALALIPDGTENVTLYDDENENWHIIQNQEGEILFPAAAAQAYRFAIAVWDRCQTIIGAAVGTLQDQLPQLAREEGWDTEWLRGDITRSQLDARLNGCEHPTVNVKIFETTGSRRCQDCALWLPRVEAEDR